MTLLKEIMHIKGLNLDDIMPAADWDKQNAKCTKRECEDMLNTKIFFKKIDTNKVLNRRNYTLYRNYPVFIYFSKKRNEIYVCLQEKYCFNFHIITMLGYIIKNYKNFKVGLNV